MNNKFTFFLLVALAIITFDATASVASRIFEFDYTLFSPISYLLYILAGFFGCRYFNFLIGLLAGFIAGFVDSTFGWVASSAIQPYLPFEQPSYTPSMIFLIVISVSINGAFWGLIGSSAYYLFSNKPKKLK